VDFKGLNEKLISSADSVIQEWFPSAKREGNEYKLGSINGEPGKSLSINKNSGVWKDFASGDGGADLISLFAASRGLTQAQAYSQLGGEKTNKPKPRVRKKIPYRYTDEYIIERVEYEDGSKAMYGKYKGKNKHHPVPRPLFKPQGELNGKPILIVEGEKSAIKGAEVLGQYYSVISWPMGTKNVSGANWEEIGSHKKPILIWPDCDDVGYKAASEIAQILIKKGNEVSLLDPKKKPLFKNEDGWDVVDVAQKLRTTEAIIKWAKEVKTELPGLDQIPSLLEKQKKDKKKASSENNLEGNLSVYQDVELQKGKGGVPINNELNCFRILSTIPDFKDMFYYDSFYAANIIRDSRDGLRKIHDTDITNMQLAFQMKAGLVTIKATTVRNSLELFCQTKKSSHPMEWMNSLKWDGTSRISDFFKKYIKSDYPDEYTEAIAKNFFVSAVARIFDPGCKVDNMLVLQSLKQGIYKSTALEVLAGDRWYSAINGKMGSKEFVENMRGYWILEMQELKDFIKASEHEQKAALSTSKDNQRDAYARYTDEKKRQSVLVGSTNDEYYLRDITGNRRVWPMRVVEVDIEALRSDRDQLWAEAVVLYKAGATWWTVPTKVHAQICQSVHLDNLDKDAWEDIIGDYFNERSGLEGYFTVSDVFKHILSLTDASKIKRNDRSRVVSSLKNLDFVKTTCGPDRKSMYVSRSWENRQEPYPFDSPYGTITPKHKLRVDY